MPNKAVFLDRDNTIIHDPGYLSDPATVRLLPGTDLAIKTFNKAGYKVIVVTNQSGVARGLITLEELQAIHDEIRDQLGRKLARVDAIYSCPFHPDGTIREFAIDSDLRKPRPGMLLRAAKDFDIDLSASWMIGDSPRDIEAGHRAGCRTIQLIGSSAAKAPVGEGQIVAPNYTAANLVEAARIILRELSAPAQDGAKPPAVMASPAPARQEPRRADSPDRPAQSQPVAAPLPPTAAKPKIDPPPEAPRQADSRIATPPAPELPVENPREEMPFAGRSSTPREIETPRREESPQEDVSADVPPQQEDDVFEEPMKPVDAEGAEVEEKSAPQARPAKAPAGPRDSQEVSVKDVTDRELLVEILLELRRISGTDRQEGFCFTRMIATVAQGLAILVLVSALANRIYGYTPADTLVGDTIAWVMVSIVLQVMAVAFWIMRRNP